MTTWVVLSVTMRLVRKQRTGHGSNAAGKLIDGARVDLKSLRKPTIRGKRPTRVLPIQLEPKVTGELPLTGCNQRSRS